MIPVEIQVPKEEDSPEIRRTAPQTITRRDEAVALIIDDDAQASDLIRQMIEREGLRVETAANGDDGLRLAREIKPALITLDILMPGRDGWSVLAALRADPDLSATPVIIVSILDESRRGYSLGATGFLTKPVDREGLRAAIGRLVGSAIGAKVLVVEDDDATRVMLRRLLVGEGCLVSEAGDGQAALALVAEFKPDLILLDLIMPKMDGFSFIEALRLQQDGAGIPVIVVTAADLSEDDAERLSGEVKDIVRKSGHNLEELGGVLRERIAEIIGRNRVKEGDQE